MRGAQPAAECPRCHHKQPPSEGALATCQKCGLSYPPKELQVRTRNPTAAPATSTQALALVPPRALIIDERDDDIAYRWTDSPGMGFLIPGFMALLGVYVLTGEATMREKAFYLILAVVLSVYAVIESRPAIKITVDKNQLRTPHTTLLLADIDRIEVERNRIFAFVRYDKRLLIGAPKDRAIADYVGEHLTRRITRT